MILNQFIMATVLKYPFWRYIDVVADLNTMRLHTGVDKSGLFTLDFSKCFAAQEGE